MRTIKINTPMNRVRFSEDFSERYAMGCSFITREVSIMKETDKAYQLSRFIDSKGKEYTCWLPKKAVSIVESTGNASVKDWVYNDSYKTWFLTA